MLNLSDVHDAIQSQTLTGFCLDCGEPSPVESETTRRAECPHCHEPQLYSAELIIQLI